VTQLPSGLPLIASFLGQQWRMHRSLAVVQTFTHNPESHGGTRTRGAQHDGTRRRTTTLRLNEPYM
jgi:hypothetical protein